ncbi:MAG: Trypsin-like peptidase domain [Candidatus Parcubacteria bacterium]|jgi:S1-C subfamily serine protease
MTLIEKIGQKIVSSIVGITTLITGSSTPLPPAATPTQPLPTAVEQQLKIQDTSIPLTQKEPVLKITGTATSTKVSSKKASTPTSGPKIIQKVAITATTSQSAKTSIKTLDPKAPQTPRIDGTFNDNSPLSNTSTTTKKILVASTTVFYTPEPVQKIALPTESNELQARIQNSLVNIYCTTKEGNTEKILTGSGTIIDSRGIVLTNAHVAQYLLLLKDFSNINLKCSARLGSPTSVSYDLDILYISPRWVEINYKNLAQERPQETGEFDFALLKLKNDGQNAQSFSYLPLVSIAETPYVNQKIILAAYPALVLQKQSINSLLRSLVDNTTVRDYFSFNGKYIDLIQTQTTPIAEPGSSGGAVTDEHGNLIGMITTILSSNNLDRKYVHAITVRHINETLSLYKRSSLSEILSLSTQTLKEDFDASQRERLRSLLITGLKTSQ